jgi:hypothetical protein
MVTPVTCDRFFEGAKEVFEYLETIENNNTFSKMPKACLPAFESIALRHLVHNFLMTKA